MKNNLVFTLFFIALLLHFSQTMAAVAPETELVINLKASRFIYSPDQIHIKTGQTVILELESTDQIHGFAIPELGIHTAIKPGEKVNIKLTVSKAGRYLFHCDIFCGSGHEEMAGELIVED